MLSPFGPTHDLGCSTVQLQKSPALGLSVPLLQVLAICTDEQVCQPHRTRLVALYEVIV